MKKLKIKNPDDARKICHIIIGNIVTGKKLAYFNLVVDHKTGDFSHAFFTPFSEFQKQKGGLVMVGDYLKVVLLLMSHPYVHGLEYDPDGNCIHGVFECPLEIDEGEPTYSNV